MHRPVGANLSVEGVDLGIAGGFLWNRSTLELCFLESLQIKGFGFFRVGLWLPLSLCRSHLSLSPKPQKPKL